MRFRDALERTLAGEPAAWPDDLSEDEIRLLRHHGVAPLVYAAAHLPQLRDEAIRAAGFEPHRLADLREVLAALAGQGAGALILKGTALAYSLYDAPELRPRTDTDLLVPKEAMDDVRAVLLGLGFQERVSSGDEHGLQQATFTRGMHVYDVHWAVTNRAVFADVLRYDELASRAVALPRIGEHALGLSHVDALLLACVHRVVHHHNDERLIWLRDIVLLVDAMSRDEKRAFWHLAVERGVAGICIQSIELACGASGAEEFLTAEEIARDEPSRLFLRDVTRGREMLVNLRALPWGARLRRLRQLAFPPAAFMEQSFGTRNRLALPWLYLWRGARGIARLFRRA